MYKIVLISAVFIYSFSSASSQGARWSENQLDSIKTELRKGSINKSDFNVIEDLVIHYANDQIDSMQTWAELGIKYAEMEDDLVQKGRFQNHLAKKYFLGAEYRKSRKIYNQILELKSGSKNDGAALAGLALSYVYSEHQDSVLYYGLQAENMYPETQDTVTQINNLMTIFQVYLQQANLSGAKEYLDEVSELVFTNRKQKWYGQVLAYSGTYYLGKADKVVNQDSVLRDKYLDTAKIYYIKAYDEYEKFDMNRFCATALYNIGLIHERKGEWQEALDRYTAGRSIMLLFNNPSYTRRFDMQRGAMLLKLGEFNELIPLLKTSVDYYKEIGDNERLVDTFKELSEAYQGLGDWKQALLYKNVEVNTRLETIDSISIKKNCRVGSQIRDGKERKANCRTKS